MVSDPDMTNIDIVLNRPRYPENIGAAARALRNMGLGRLVVVNPENCDPSRILKMATHAAAEVVEQMDRYDDLKEALSPYHYIVGTTARLGGAAPDCHVAKRDGQNAGSDDPNQSCSGSFRSRRSGIVKRCHPLLPFAG